jgi:hypothetical protein
MTNGRANRIVLILAFWVTSLLLPLVPSPVGAAGEFSYDNKITYSLRSGGLTDVTEEYTVTNNTARQYLTEIKTSAPGDELKDLRASYSDGGSIPATSEKVTVKRGDLSLDAHQVKVVFPRQIYGMGRKWTFRINYTVSGLVDVKGGAHTLYVPAIERSDNSTYRITVDAPEALGTAHFAGAQYSSSGKTGGRQIFTFNATTEPVVITFGDSTVYKLNFNFPLHNDSPLPRTLTVTLPPDLNNQKSYVNKLDPAPSNLKLDADGNVLAEYRLSPGQKITVKTDISGEVKFLEYDLSASKMKSDIPADLKERYTKPSRYWQTDGAVAEEAAKLNNDSRPVIENVRAMYDHVIQKLSYNKDKIQFNIRQGAAKALAQPDNTVCLEYADLLVAMLRSQGIPARMPVGYAYQSGFKTTASVSDSLHSWVEAYVPGIGWITLDPTWGEDERASQFGKSDMDHFAFAVWGERDQEPAAVMAGRRDLGYEYQESELTFDNKVFPLEPAAQVTVQRYSLLPFVTLERVAVKAASQVATDGNFVELGGRKIDFGSLAPGEKAVTHGLVLGSAWLAAEESKFMKTDGDQVLVLAASTVRIDHMPMVLLLALILAAAAILIWRARRGKSTVEITEEVAH